MATLEQTLERLGTLLKGRMFTDNGRLEEQGYKVSSQELYLHAAATALRNVPFSKWDVEEIITGGWSFCERFPRIYGTLDHHSYELPNNRWLVQNAWSTGLTFAQAEGRTTRKVMRPSVTRAGVVLDDEVSPEEALSVKDRVSDLHSHLERRLRDAAAELFDEGQVLRITHQITNGYNARMAFASGLKWSRHLYVQNLLHDSDNRLSHEFLKQAAEVLSTSRKEMSDRLKRMFMDIEKAVEKTGLPVKVRMVPGTMANYYALLVDGYGDTGQPSTVHVSSFADDPRHNNQDIEQWVKYMLKGQALLHRRYGPRPGAQSRLVWKIDAPAARMVARHPRGMEILREFMELGSADTQELGLSLRVADKTILGTITLGQGVVWKGDRLEVEDTQLSDTVIMAIKGRSIRKIVEHPVLGEDDLAGSAKIHRTKFRTALVVKAKPRLVPLSKIVNEKEFQPC